MDEELIIDDKLGKSMMFAFSNITKVIIAPNSVISKIDSCAFSNCHNLRSVTISKNIVRLCKKCFLCCISLHDFIIPEDSKLEIIEKYVFDCSENLQDIDLPQSLKYVGIYSLPKYLKKFEITDNILKAKGNIVDGKSIKFIRKQHHKFTSS